MNIHVSRNGQSIGTFTLEDVNRQLQEAKLMATDLAWQEGMSEWQPLSKIPGVIIPKASAGPPPLPNALPNVEPPPIPESRTDPDHEEVLRLFVGPNYQYYSAQWRREETRRYTWNWAATFLGLGWLAYRKMYRYAAIFLAVVVGEILCEVAFDLSGSVENVLNLALFLTLGRIGNHLYKVHAEKSAAEIIGPGPLTESVKVRLSAQGGTSVGIALGYAAVFILLFILIAVE
jgi:hypothetical protein